MGTIAYDEKRFVVLLAVGGGPGHDRHRLERCSDGITRCARQGGGFDQVGGVEKDKPGGNREITRLALSWRLAGHVNSRLPRASLASVAKGW